MRKASLIYAMFLLIGSFQISHAVPYYRTLDKMDKHFEKMMNCSISIKDQFTYTGPCLLTIAYSFAGITIVENGKDKIFFEAMKKKVNGRPVTENSNIIKIGQIQFDYVPHLFWNGGNYNPKASLYLGVVKEIDRKESYCLKSATISLCASD